MKVAIVMLTLLSAEQPVSAAHYCACESAPWHVPMQVVEGLQVAYRRLTGIMAEARAMTWMQRIVKRQDSTYCSEYATNLVLNASDGDEPFESRAEVWIECVYKFPSLGPRHVVKMRCRSKGVIERQAAASR